MLTSYLHPSVSIKLRMFVIDLPPGSSKRLGNSGAGSMRGLTISTYALSLEKSVGVSMHELDSPS